MLRLAVSTALKAKPNIVGSKPYTGNSDLAAQHRPGMDEFIRQAVHTCPALWNNGSYGQRPMRGSTDTPSVHGTGRAVDMSWRHIDGKGMVQGRKVSIPFIEKLLANANTLGIEMLIDYFPKPYGEAWRCDRQAWVEYDKPTVHGAPGGDWYHIEIAPQMADSVIAVKTAWLKVFGEIHQ